MGKVSIHHISVRSYTRPTVDILLNGETIKRFTANSVDVARSRAVKYAKQAGFQVSP